MNSLRMTTRIESWRDRFRLAFYILSGQRFTLHILAAEVEIVTAPPQREGGG